MRILIADKRAEVRSALRLLLENEPDITVAGEVAEAGFLLENITDDCPDLLLLDWLLPDLQASKLLPVLHSRCPCLRIIALCGQPDRQSEAILNGADAFISKVDSPDNLLSVIRKCCHLQQQDSRLAE